MKVSELEGSQLDYLTAKARGWTVYAHDQSSFRTSFAVYVQDIDTWKPSTNWSQCGPLIEEYQIATRFVDIVDSHWHAQLSCDDGVTNGHRGATPLIAACRCIVSSAYGEEVDVV